MPIEVRCECGKRLRARDGSAGKRVKCPACGAAVSVPAGEPEEGPTPTDRPGRPTPNEGNIDIWTEPAVALPGLVALNAEVLCLATVFRTTKMNETRRKLELGQAPKNVLGIGSTVIPLAAVTGACMDRKRGDAQISHTGDEKPATIQFSDLEAASEFMESLRRRLGPGWVTWDEQHGRLRASLKPAFGGCVSLAVALALACAGPFHNWGVGCIFVFVVLAFFASMAILGIYLIQPPLMVYLARRG
jgi:hypothetical protein